MIALLNQLVFILILLTSPDRWDDSTESYITKKLPGIGRKIEEYSLSFSDDECRNANLLRMMSYTISLIETAAIFSSNSNKFYLTQIESILREHQAVFQKVKAITLEFETTTPKISLNYPPLNQTCV